MRLFVTAGLLWILISRIGIGQAAVLVCQLSPVQLILAIIALALSIPVNTLRWRTIVGLESSPPQLFALLKISLVGLFFNQILPTGIGGDAVRAWRLQKLGIGNLGTAIRSVLLDRAAGYFILVVLYACGLPLLLAANPEPRQQLVVIAGLATAASGLFALLIMDFMPRFLSRLPILNSLATLSRQARNLCGDVRKFTMIIFLSSLSTGLTVLCVKLLGDGLDVRLSYATWLAIVPPVAFVQLLPVSLAGWGIRGRARCHAERFRRPHRERRDDLASVWSLSNY